VGAVDLSEERPRVDLSEFAGHMSAAERTRLMQERFPSTRNLNWDKAFANDVELLGRLLRDILKVDMAVPGRPGPRPGLDRVRAQPLLDEVLGRDPTDHPYALLEFPQAFRLLIGNRSIRHAQTKLGMSKSRIHRLLRGIDEPSQAEMEHIATVFGKQPSYFLEYRVIRITRAIYSHLAEEPDVSIRVYERISQAATR
jgi:hypothetical protein